MRGSAASELRQAAVTTFRTGPVPIRTTASPIDVISVAGALNAELASWMTRVASTGSFDTTAVMRVAETSGSSARSTTAVADAGSIGTTVSADCSQSPDRIQSTQSTRVAEAFCDDRIMPVESAGGRGP